MKCSLPPEAEVLRIPPLGTPRGSVSDEGDATLVMGSGSKPPSEGRRSTSKKANRRFQLESSRNSGDTYYARKSITHTRLSEIFLGVKVPMCIHFLGAKRECISEFRSFT